MSGMIMRGSDWVPLRGIDQRRLSEARLQAHYAVQWLGRAARAYVRPLPDDEHTNLGWDASLGGFTTFLMLPRNPRHHNFPKARRNASATRSVTYSRPQYFRMCCKTLFAPVMKNSPDHRSDFRVKMWGTSSPDDKLTGDLDKAIVAHRFAVVGWILLLRKSCH